MMPRGSALSTAMRRVSEVSACRLPGQDALLKRNDLCAVAGVIEQRDGNQQASSHCVSPFGTLRVQDRACDCSERSCC